jgi:hypothetical protein
MVTASLDYGSVRTDPLDDGAGSARIRVQWMSEGAAAEDVAAERFIVVIAEEVRDIGWTGLLAGRTVVLHLFGARFCPSDGATRWLASPSSTSTFFLRDESLHLNFGIDMINQIKAENPRLLSTSLQDEVLLHEACAREVAYGRDTNAPRAVLALNAGVCAEFTHVIPTATARSCDWRRCFPQQRIPSRGGPK